MTGPDHYREAERLLAEATTSPETTFEGHNPIADRDLAAAQVHAMLALAATTALAAGVNGHMPRPDYNAWYDAASTADPEKDHDLGGTFA